MQVRMKKWELSFIANRNAKWYSPFGRYSGSIQNSFTDIIKTHLSKYIDPVQHSSVQFSQSEHNVNYSELQLIIMD